MHEPRTTKMHPPHGVDVDRDISHLIRACWRRGLRTRAQTAGDARDRGRGFTLHGSASYGALAAIQFESMLEAATFAATAGPFGWSQRDHATRRLEFTAAQARADLDWRWAGDTVQFPHRDIARATRALERQQWTLTGLIGAADASAPAKRSRPARSCQSCGEPVPPWLRRDAIYCSRRCQLKARVRGQPRGVDRATTDPTLRARLRGKR